MDRFAWTGVRTRTAVIGGQFAALIVLAWIASRIERAVLDAINDDMWPDFCPTCGAVMRDGRCTNPNHNRSN